MVQFFLLFRHLIKYDHHLLLKLCRARKMNEMLQNLCSMFWLSSATLSRNSWLRWKPFSTSRKCRTSFLRLQTPEKISCCSRSRSKSCLSSISSMTNNSCFCTVVFVNGSCLPRSLISICLSLDLHPKISYLNLSSSHFNPSPPSYLAPFEKKATKKEKKKY